VIDVPSSTPARFGSPTDAANSALRIKHFVNAANGCTVLPFPPLYYTALLAMRLESIPLSLMTTELLEGLPLEALRAHLQAVSALP
jgi:hypothetical protein